MKKVMPSFNVSITSKGGYCWTIDIIGMVGCIWLFSLISTPIGSIDYGIDVLDLLI